MKSLRWRIAVWFTLSVLAVLAAFAVVTYAHLTHELRNERHERARPETNEWVLHGGYSQSEVDDIAGELWRLSLLYAAPVALVALGLGYALARRSLRPVADINRQLEAIGARSLDQRVYATDADAEFRAIEGSINALLARLEATFHQLTEFSAQVAHELRTPMTLMRLQVEEAAGRIDPALAESLQEELRRLSDYIDQCLLLATAEQGRLSVHVTRVRLVELVRAMLEVYDLLAREERRAVSVSADAGAAEGEVSADPAHVRQMLHNLLTNALRHGTGEIRVVIDRAGGELVCRVENRIAVSPRDPERTGGNAGMGLRIVRALATAQGCRFEATPTPDGAFVARLAWPCS